jgi:hypothetical protein
MFLDRGKAGVGIIIPRHPGRVVNLLTEYLDRAVQLEGMAANEPDSAFKDQLLAQAQAYRKRRRGRKIMDSRPRVPDKNSG